MDITNLGQQAYADLFADSAVDSKGPIHFGANSSPETVDLFNVSTGDTTTIAPEPQAGDTGDSSVTDTTTLEPVSTTDTTTLNTDILGVDSKGQPGRKPKYNFSDISGYFEDRIKSGKFVQIEEEEEDGSKKLFIPKTPEEFDEVIDIQVNHRLEQEKRDLSEKIYQSKSPAWQAVLKFSEMVDDPSEVLPFIVGVKNIDSVKDLDPADTAGAEQIVRSRLQQRGEAEDVIAEQIEALKTTDKLVSTAQKYKPLILQEEKKRLSEMAQNKQREEQEYFKTVMSIKENAVKAIEAPLFGKQKLKQEEKAAIYDLIAVPAEEQGGYPIYTRIDNLFQTGDFETLKQIALLLTKREAFLGYIAAGAADKTAEGLQRKLRVANDSRSSSSSDANGDDDQRNVVQRNKYTPKFGR